MADCLVWGNAKETQWCVWPNGRVDVTVPSSNGKGRNIVGIVSDEMHCKLETLAGGMQ